MTTTATGFATLWATAHEAGKAAAEAAVVEPMIVGESKSPFFDDTIDTSKPVYFIAGGVCGFAWVWFKGNTAFGRWAKKMGYAHNGYQTGLNYRIHAYGQSMQRKEAYASAFAAVLREAGIVAHAESRMD